MVGILLSLLGRSIFMCELLVSGSVVAVFFSIGCWLIWFVWLVLLIYGWVYSIYIYIYKQLLLSNNFWSNTPCPSMTRLQVTHPSPQQVYPGPWGCPYRWSLKKHTHQKPALVIPKTSTLIQTPASNWQHYLLHSFTLYLFFGNFTMGCNNNCVNQPKHKGKVHVQGKIPSICPYKDPAQAYISPSSGSTCQRSPKRHHQVRQLR